MRSRPEGGIEEKKLEGVALAIRVPALLFHRHLSGFDRALQRGWALDLSSQAFPQATSRQVQSKISFSPHILSSSAIPA